MGTSSSSMRGTPHRLLAVISVAFALDWTFYSALTPLVPDLQRELGMSDGAVGVLVGSYALGILGAALPSGWLTGRIGARSTMVVSLVVFACATVAFGFASTTVGLTAARFLQGVAASLTWAAGLTWLLGVGPPERHGALIGTATSASIAGALVGPPIGALAVHVGRGVVFSSIGLCAVVLALVLQSFPAPRREGTPGTLAALRALAKDGGLLAGWIILMAGLVTGAMVVLAPLSLDAIGLGATAIAILFLVVAVLEIITGPVVGRFSDDRGRWPTMSVVVGLTAVVLCLLATDLPAPMTVACIVLVLPAGLASITPAYTILGAVAETGGVAIAAVMGVGNLAWAAGESGGALGAGWLDGAGADTLAYVGLAALALGTLVGLRAYGRRPAARAAAADDSQPLGP